MEILISLKLMLLIKPVPKDFTKASLAANLFEKNKTFLFNFFRVFYFTICENSINEFMVFNKFFYTIIFNNVSPYAKNIQSHLTIFLNFFIILDMPDTRLSPMMK